MNKTMMRRLLPFVVAVDVVALAGLLAAVPGESIVLSGPLALLGGMALAFGARPVQLPGRKVNLTATQPFVLAALAVMGPLPAVAVAMLGVIGAWLGGRRAPSLVKAAFNLGAIPLAVLSSAWAFHLAGGTTGAVVSGLLWPLLLATTVYYAANTGLVALAIALETRRSPTSVWRVSFLWTAVSYFSGFSFAAGLALLARGIGLWALALAIPPCWLLLEFYRATQARLDEHRCRVVEVEALNERLQRTVTELQEAMAHVRQLQGLLPICMHCKSIRDDRNTWHKLESYISRHSEIRFTHSLCESCESRHYSNLKAENTG